MANKEVLENCDDCKELKDINEPIIRGIALGDNKTCYDCLVKMMTVRCKYSSHTYRRCEDLGCSTCHDKSFSSDPKSKYWSEKNDNTPRFIGKANNTKVYMICPEGHEEYAAIRNFTRRETHCKLCEPPPQQRKMAWEYAHETFKFKGYKLLMDKEEFKKEYEGANITKLRFECPKGHFGSMIWASFQGGKECFECYGNKKPDWNKIIRCFKDKKYILLSEETDYENNQSILCYICENDHYCETMWQTIQKGHGCKTCASIIGGSKLKIKWEIIEEEFKKYNFELISDEKDYDNCKTDLKYICPNGHEGKVTWSGFRRNHGCYECTGSMWKKWEDIVKRYKERGYTLSSKEDDYEGRETLLTYICPNNHKYTQSWHSFNAGKGCHYCRYKSEGVCRDILEELLGVKFVKKRPRFLKGLEYDLYNKDLKLAIEYNGLQHYEYNEHLHRGNIKNFTEQQERDAEKARLSEKNGIKLLIVPHKYSHMNKNSMKDYIENLLIVSGFLKLNIIFED